VFVAVYVHVFMGVCVCLLVFFLLKKINKYTQYTDTPNYAYKETHSHTDIYTHIKTHAYITTTYKH